MKKTAIITGASRGIGYAAAKKLGMDGCQVVLFATGEKERYKAAIDGLTQAGITWHYVRGSLDCREDRERLIRETVEKFGRIDILVNNAGVAPKERKDLLEMSEESFDRVLGINTKGTMFLTQLAAKQMIKQEQIFKSKGHIVNVGSCSAEVSSTSRGEYCVSKAAVSMLTTLFADRLAPEGILAARCRAVGLDASGQHNADPAAGGPGLHQRLAPAITADAGPQLTEQGAQFPGRDPGKKRGGL